MDEDLKTLLAALLESDPEAPLDDSARGRVVYAMLSMQPREHLIALWKFAGSIKNKFTRSHLLHKLARLVASRAIEKDLAVQIAKSIPDSYWRFDALGNVAAELLEQASHLESFPPNSDRLRERALSFLKEVAAGLPLIREEDGARAAVLAKVGLSLVRAEELDWAESLVSTTKYCPENTEVLLNSAKARSSLGQTSHAIRLSKTVAQLARVGPGNPMHRVFDLENASELAFACGHKDEAREYLEEASELALASEVDHDIEGWKCLAAFAIVLPQLEMERAFIR